MKLVSQLEFVKKMNKDFEKLDVDDKENVLMLMYLDGDMVRLKTNGKKSALMDALLTIMEADAELALLFLETTQKFLKPTLF